MGCSIDFINLSSGLAWLDLPQGPRDFRLVRIQSTACEQKRWSFIIEDLSYEFLIRAARGDTCRVWDTSARKEVSRAIYQGLPWIRYASERRWLGISRPAFVKGCNAEGYFDQCFRHLSDRAKGKLDYTGKFLATTEVRLESRCVRSGLDGKYGELSSLLQAA